MHLSVLIGVVSCKQPVLHILTTIIKKVYLIKDDNGVML
jgi:hypothetical protein